MADPTDDALKRLFEEALSIPPEERAEWLDAACGLDRQLRREVESLLEHHAQGTMSILKNDAPRGLQSHPENYKQSAEIPTGVVFPPVLGLKPPQRVGPYKILERLGEGGMGIVYAAEQTEPIRRKVALKLIKVGMDTRQVVARFEAERQALAMMDHRKVARVLDAGATPEGRPYFVMGFVRGVPVTEYCDRHRVPIEERLRLFAQVCAGVQHAHQKGIIHRDIKPSNILVTVEEDQPVPKVIDFGVAKATEQRLTERTLVGTKIVESTQA